MQHSYAPTNAIPNSTSDFGGIRPTINQPLSINLARTLQTSLTNEQLAKHNLIVLEKPQNVELLGSFFGETQNRASAAPILIKLTNYRNLAKEPASRITALPCAWLAKFKKRLDALREFAAEDDIVVSEASVEQAFCFAAKLRDVAQPDTFLLGNGNIRLLWLNTEKEQVGLQFLGDGRAQYICFRKTGKRLETTMGDRDCTALMPFISGLGLMHVMQLS
jgi:hypothetical protein